MSRLRERLILQALAALSEIADECGHKPARKSITLRFLLAYTYVASGEDRSARWLWNDFWRQATGPEPSQPHDRMMAVYIRSTGARSALNGICRAVGFEPTVDLLKMLRDQSNTSRGRTANIRERHAANDEPPDGDAA